MIGQVFDRRGNALNLWRLILAVEVILWHSFPVTGHSVSSPVAERLLFSLGVDGFFAVSGFLVAGSWLNHPEPMRYVRARGLRILPGFYTCLVVTAFVFAPIGVALQGGSALGLLHSGGPLQFVAFNSAIAQLKLDVDGTPRGVPHPGTWNASLWTLVFEVMCYLVVLVLGVAGIARHRWTSSVVLALGVVAALLLPPMADPWSWTVPQCLARFAIMFAAGAVLYQLSDVIPARWTWVAASFAIVAISGLLLPDYRIVGALPLAYLIIVSGILVHRFHLHNDLSYGVYIYAWPTQQLLVICGLGRLAPLAFAVVATVATLPLAAASWFAIEKPALRLKAARVPHRRMVRVSSDDL
ncbi:acyltransferase [Mycobacterium scrofulaceum]|uniref:acyltransferase family protein n=1 Tax=Mycobacterium scrofulaceum TaxID=1783 RepID=UPI000800D291|nr:acyltransferase [Mycobacterium scrofulaceum]OBH79860.1 acyltransferase [Mycobacterium scrofulaceum]